MNPRAVIDKLPLGLILSVLFTLVFGYAAVFIHPTFPVISLYPFEISYWFPLLAFVIPFWLLYFKKNKLSLLWLFTGIPACWLLNVNTLRPDLYFLWLCLLLFSITDKKETREQGLLLIMAGMYTWTGIYKLNTEFVQAMSFSIRNRIPISFFSEESYRYVSMMLPPLEIVLGLFCVLPFKKGRAFLGILLHLGILFFLIAGNSNRSMIFWNVSLLLMHITLSGFSFKKEIWIQKRNLFVPLLAIVFPVLYLFSAWPVFASWTMYSARFKHSFMVIDEQTALSPPAYIRNQVYTQAGVYSVNISGWADEQTGGSVCQEVFLAERVLVSCKSYIAQHP